MKLETPLDKHEEIGFVDDFFLCYERNFMRIFVQGSGNANSCKKCEIFDQFNNVVWSTDECGGEVYNMELRAKAEAYDYGCDHTLRCNSYKK